MKKILVPTDFSDCAKAAEALAFEIALRAQAEIHFLHIIMTPLDWVKLPKEKEKNFPEIQAQIGHAEAALSELKQKAVKLGLHCETVINFNQGREEINEHIKAQHHDFVVMGSHGTKGIKELIGSNTQKVVRYAGVPVLVVKHPSSLEKWHKIVFASNFDQQAIHPFKEVVEFAGFLEAKIKTLYVNIPGRFRETDEIERHMKAFMKPFKDVDSSEHYYDALTVERGILKFSAHSKSTIIAVATHGDKGLLNWFNPSITEQLVNHSERPVLCLSIDD